MSGGRKIPLEKEALMAHDTLCEDLERILGREPDYEKASRLKNMGQRVSFERNKGENELQLGRFEVANPTYREIKFTHMSAISVTTDGRLAKGDINGKIEIFSARGQQQGTLRSGVYITALSFLTGGHYVLRDDRNNITLHMGNFKYRARFETLNYARGGFGGLTVDSDNYIYVSYKTPRKIQVFNPAGGKPVREFACHGYEPIQIFAMKQCKRLVVSDDASVRVIDECGVVLAGVSKDGHYCHPHPAVCHDDSIIIAWVKHEEGVLTVDRYTSMLHYVTTLVGDFQIRKPMLEWYHLQEFVSGEIAFCTPDRLYIFNL